MSAVSNHVFTCCGCSRQWTVVSDHELECFFIGLCYWCLQGRSPAFVDSIREALQMINSVPKEQYAKEV